MATNYSKLKNAELEDLLRARSLPHSGKKADLIARLQQHDLDQSSATTPQTAGTSAKLSGETAGADDVIDWEDAGTDNDEAVTNSTVTNAAISIAAKPQPSAAGAAAIAAGGQGQPPNPTAVPNQIPAIDPSKTSDLTVHEPSSADVTNVSTTSNRVADAAPPPSSDFTKGLSTTSLDTELEKRKARAARFGLPDPSTTESVKALERAKRFGLDAEKGEEKVVESIDSALPERRKRGRDAGAKGDVPKAGNGEGEERAGKRQDSRRREGRGGRSRGEGKRNASKGRTNGNAADAGGGTKKPQGKISEADRLAAEERKKRFATAK
jgi:SAP domain-containing ribonucleoprotein